MQRKTKNSQSNPSVPNSQVLTSSPSDKRTVGILQPSYLPWAGFFDQIHHCDIFVFYDDVQFEKGSWRNRNRIKTANGLQWLTVPVMLKGRHFPLIRDVEINASVPWQKKHMKSVVLNYSKAPFFESHADGFFRILDRSWKYLLDLNLELIHWFMEQLQISTPTVLSSDLNIQGASVGRLLGIICSLQGNCFYEGSAGRNYIDEGVFEEAGITLKFQDYEHPVYPQPYGDFVSHLSIIDLLFNCGPESLDLLSGTSQKEKK